MPKDVNHQTYHYNAHGHALSGAIRRPLEHLIEVQAAVSLPLVGGFGSARVDDFRFQEFVTCKSAYSHVSGSREEEDGTHTTQITSTVEQLNILDMVTADRVVARISSQHPAPHHEPAIIFLGSKFENLRIAGCPVEVELDHELYLRLNTFEAFRKEFQSNAEFRKMAEDPYQTGRAQTLPDAHGVVLCSLVKNMKTSCPGVERRGHVFIVPQFGKIYVAEFLAEEGQRTLTMLRLELGSPVSATIVVTQTMVNGRPYPPTP